MLERQAIAGRGIPWVRLTELVNIIVFSLPRMLCSHNNHSHAIIDRHATLTSCAVLEDTTSWWFQQGYHQKELGGSKCGTDCNGYEKEKVGMVQPHDKERRN